MSYVYLLFQTSLLIFNALYFVVGVASIVLAVIFNWNSTPLIDLIKTIYKIQYELLNFGLIFYGFSLIVIGVLACYSLFKRSKFLLIIYFLLLLILFLIKLTCCMLIYFQSNYFFVNFSNKLYEKMMQNYGTNENSSHAINYIQKTYHCCGVKSAQDWLESNYISSAYERSNLARTPLNLITNSNLSYIYKIPHSCCINRIEENCVLSLNKYYEIGCEMVLKEKFDLNKSHLIFTIALLTILPLLSLLLLLLLISFMSKSKITKSKSIASLSNNNEGSVFVSDLSLPDIGKFQAVKKNKFYNSDDINNSRISYAYDLQPPYTDSKYL
jgi:hypothetical protein